MRKTRFSEEQIAYALRQAESGTVVSEVCRKLEISEQTFYRWKRKFEKALSVATSNCWLSTARGTTRRLRCSQL